MTASQQESLLRLLTRVQQGELDITAAADLIASDAKSVQTTDACVDVDRANRCGFPEVVYGEGKTAESIEAIFRALIENHQACLATRVSTEQASHLTTAFPSAKHNAVARTIRLQTTDTPKDCGTVFVLAAGTTDRPVAEEALETLHWMGVPAELIVDIGVAGPHRLQQQVDRLQSASAIVVTAGMEGALPSVVGGHVACPVIGVPTSVGYGANFGGLSALLSMLNSCAANVITVNIDAGFKGGYVAGLIATQASK